MTRDTFRKGIGILAASFPEKEIVAEVAFTCLKDLTDEQFVGAIILILKTEKQINKATNIIALIRDKALIKPQQLAGEAWLNVRKKILSVGSYGLPTFTDPLTERAVDMIGWRNLCLSENQMADRAHFLKIYDTLVAREDRQLLEGKLIDFKGKEEARKLIAMVAREL